MKKLTYVLAGPRRIVVATLGAAALTGSVLLGPVALAQAAPAPVPARGHGSGPGAGHGHGHGHGYGDGGYRSCGHWWHPCSWDRKGYRGLPR
jgi:hypothetical protein